MYNEEYKWEERLKNIKEERDEVEKYLEIL